MVTAVLVETDWQERLHLDQPTQQQMGGRVDGQWLIRGKSRTAQVCSDAPRLCQGSKHISPWCKLPPPLPMTYLFLLSGWCADSLGPHGAMMNRTLLFGADSGTNLAMLDWADPSSWRLGNEWHQERWGGWRGGTDTINVDHSCPHANTGFQDSEVEGVHVPRLSSLNGWIYHRWFVHLDSFETEKQKDPWINIFVVSSLQRRTRTCGQMFVFVLCLTTECGGTVTVLTARRHLILLWNNFDCLIQVEDKCNKWHWEAPAATGSCWETGNRPVWSLSPLS